MPAPSYSRKGSVTKSRQHDQPQSPNDAAPVNRMMIRRRTSIQQDNQPPPQALKREETPPRSAPTVSETEEFMLRSDTYAYDSGESSDDEKKKFESDGNSRKLTFANMKYLLHSFESGHWSMMGDCRDDDGQLGLAPIQLLSLSVSLLTSLLNLARKR
jgi:hypothetical protein